MDGKWEIDSYGKDGLFLRKVDAYNDYTGEVLYLVYSGQKNGTTSYPEHVPYHK